jgi:lactoylglutathione lyase
VTIWFFFDRRAREGQKMGFAVACRMEKFEFLCPVAKLAKKHIPALVIRCGHSLRGTLNSIYRLIPTHEVPMKYLHTMIRVANLDASLDFFINKLGFVEQRRHVNDKGRFTLVFVAAPESPDAPVELTYNWDPEVYTGGRNFGHLAIEVSNIYDYCTDLQKKGITINRPPRDGNMAFIKTPDGISIELLQKGKALAIAEPWASMANTGMW